MDKKQTTILKSLAIIIMFWHHLFGCDVYLTRGVQYAYFPRVYPVTTAFAGGGRICISLFAFVSGYGMYRAYIRTGKYIDIIKYIMKFLVQYWVVLFGVAIPYLAHYGNYNPEYLLINLFAFLGNDGVLYITLSWYVKVNIGLLLICPIVKYISNRIDNILLDILVFVAVPCGIFALIPNYETELVGVVENSLSSVRLIMQWFVVYYAGVIFAKYELIEILRSKYVRVVGRKSTECSVVSLCSLIVVLFLQFLYGDNPVYSSTRAVLFIIAYDWIYYKHISTILCKNYLNNILVFLGKYSFQYWLLSGMFYGNTTEFTWLLYLPRITIIIVLWNFILLTPFAYVTKWIADKIVMLFTRYIWKCMS